MYPKWHVLYGLIFTVIIWIFSPETSWIFLGLIFFGSFLIDVDHYMCAGHKTKKWNLKENFDYHVNNIEEAKKEREKGLRKKGDFHLFHTVEFHAFIGLLGLAWIGFFYIFLGMVFHSLLDVFSLLRDDFFYRREYFLFSWLRNKV
jgi:hypothetical protein